jgi:hypothetical protein
VKPKPVGVLLLLAVASFAAFALCCAVRAQTYQVTKLETLGGDSAKATAINKLGQVAGYSHYLRWPIRRLKPLGQLVQG